MRVLTALILLASTPLFAGELYCEEFAAQAAARYAGVSVQEFRATMDLVWTCRERSDARREQLQYSDGSQMIGLSTIIINGQCALYGSIYTAQDDGDWLDESEEHNIGFCD